MIELSSGAIAQDPQAVRRRTVDLGSAALVAQGAGWLASGDTISDAEWDADGATIVNEAFDDFSVTVLVGGVTRTLDEGGHVLTCHVTTDSGEEDDFEITLFVPE
jgi:hypothetical protein